MKTPMPELLAPVADPSEVEMLIEAGASRLYCGIAPEAWTRKFTRAVWLSRRPPSASLPNLQSLAQVTCAANRHGVAVHVALNAPCLTDEQIDMVVTLCRRLIGELGVAAVIVADPALMLALGQEALPFVASTVTVLHNAEAIRFARDLGAVAAVLPRHLRLAEIRQIGSEVPGFELETLVMFDGCAWEEGLCHTVHEVGDTDAFCRTAWKYEIEPLGAPLSEAYRTALHQAQKAYRDWLRWSDACGSPYGEQGQVNGACALCAVHAIVSSGIRVLKLAGRQGSPIRRLRGVQMLRTMLDALAAGETEHEMVARAKAMRATPELCETGLMCCYPEARRTR